MIPRSGPVSRSPDRRAPIPSPPKTPVTATHSIGLRDCVCVYVPVLMCVCVRAAGARVRARVFVLPHADHWLLHTEPMQDVRAKCGRAKKAAAPTSHLGHAAAPILVPVRPACGRFSPFYAQLQEQMHFGLHAPSSAVHFLQGDILLRELEGGIRQQLL